MRKSTLMIIGVVIVAIVAIAMVLDSDWYKARGVTSFEECEEAGFAVMESFPRQCRAGDKLFIEGVDGDQNQNEDGGDNGDGGSGLERVVTDMVRVDAPLSGATVSSPLTVRGEARGGWYFEASFPLRVLDANGTEIGTGFVEAQDEWMTNEFVPFTGSVTFSTPATATGVLVLERSNPSGLPENAGEVRVPIRFSGTETAERTVTLYYYDAEKDMDAQGNIICSSQGLVGVTRTVPSTITPIQDAIRLLIEGDLTASEEARGIDTEFPLTGVSLVGASLSGGTLTLEFSDPQGRTSGGSCRISILFAQIEATAKQFPGVNQVRIIPEDIFQP